jgi:hypothetical protein
MGPKTITMIVLILIGLGVVLAGMNGFIGHNNDQDWQVLQGVFGDMKIQSAPGVFQKRFANDFVYPKIQRTYFSKDEKEGGKEDESCTVVFSDKGKADFSSMVLYRTPYLKANEAIATAEEVKTLGKGLKDCESTRFHRLCKGDVTISDKTILARLKEYARITASGMNASDCVEDQAEFIDEIRNAVKNDATLNEYGISVEEVALSDITFDPKTLLQFEKQQDAILASKEAEAKKIQYNMQELETEAQYAQKIAEQKGIAEMEMMKQTTDAKRDAELATIAAQKEVDVAALAKMQAEEVKLKALVEANQGLEVAELEAKAALEKKKGMIALAEGKQKSIELSGAITEKEEVLATIAANRDVEISANIMNMQVPSTVFLGGSGEGGGQSDYFNNLLGYVISKEAGLIPKTATPVAPAAK